MLTNIDDLPNIKELNQPLALPEKISRVIFIIEIYGRDLPGRYRIGELLRSQGACVYIVEQELARLIPSQFYKDALVYDKSVANNTARLRFYQRIVRSGGRIIVEDEEANACLADPKRYISTRVDESVLACVEALLCWNDAQLEYLLSEYPHLAAKFIVSGSTKYDSFRSHRAYSSSKVTRPLVVSNFSLITNYKSAEDYIEFKKNVSNEYDVKDSERYKQIWAEQIGQIQHLLSLSISNSFDVRPHPSDNLQRLRKIFSVAPNIKVLEPRPLIDDLKGREKLWHFNCNSSIEARLVGVEAINMAIDKSEYLSNEPFEIIGDEAIKKVFEIIFIGQCFEKSIASKRDFLLKIAEALLGIKYLVFSVVGKNRSKIESKKNIGFVDEGLRHEVKFFRRRGWQCL